MNIKKINIIRYIHLNNLSFILVYTLISIITAIIFVWASRHIHPIITSLAIAATFISLGLFFMGRRLFPAKKESHWRQAMPCYLSIQDLDLNIVETNDVFHQDFGDQIGYKCYSAYKHREEPCPDCPVLKTFKDGKVHSSEEIVIANDGQIAHVLVTSAPRFDPTGKLIGAVEMSTNITELKTLERDLELTKRDYQRLFNIVPCYITLQNRDFQIIESNELFKRDFGVRRGELCYKAYKCRNDICPECPVKETFEDGKVHSSEEVVHTPDGREVNIIAYSMPVYDENGEISSVMEVSTNITEVKQLQSRLTLMGRAVASLAHRIKNMLMGLEGGMYVLETGLKSGDKEATDEGWEMIERNVDKVSALVKDLLYCAKRREPNFKDNICPQDIVKEVYEFYNQRSALEGIKLNLELSEKLTYHRLDTDAIHSLLQNLMANAIDACRFDLDENKKSHNITLRCYEDIGGVTIIEIADDGVGIPEDVSHKVFEDFFSTKGTEGTGLGLLVANKIVEEHHGTITFTSKQGHGTTFRISLPYNQAEKEQISEAMSS